MSETFRRRTFIGGAVAGAGTLAVAGARRAIAANSRLRVAVMGTNSRGLALARGFARLPGAEVAIVCDVDQRAIEKGIKTVTEAGGAAPRGERDFRKALEDKSIDALAIAAPDHWHAPAAILACSAGKHVYVEKPSSHNPREGELLVAAARKWKRVVQMGNQRRSWARMKEAIEAVKGGAIGRVQYARGWYANARDPIGRGKPVPAPSWLDYELWQGPAPRRPFHDNVVHYNWHWFWHWGTGEAGNNGVHSVDLCRWGLGVDYPTRVTSSGGRYFARDDWETPDTQSITWEFDGGKSISWEGLSASAYGADGKGFGVTFHGDGGTLAISGSDAYAIHDRKGKEVKKVDAKTEDRALDLRGPAAGLDAVHLQNFVDGIRSGAKLASEIEEGHKSTLLTLLGNIALRTGRALRCDPKSGRILDDPKAMALWSREYARGWDPRV